MKKNMLSLIIQWPFFNDLVLLSETGSSDLVCEETGLDNMVPLYKGDWSQVARNVKLGPKGLITLSLFLLIFAFPNELYIWKSTDTITFPRQ